MDNTTLSIYIHELRNQILHTKASFDLFNQALEQRNHNGVLFAGQLVLLPAAHLSNILWPTRARSRNRGEALRKVLQLAEKHPLNDRRLSELWEHTDQKIDDYITGTKGKNIVIDFVGDPATLYEDGQIEDKHIYRAYDPDKRIFYFRGVAYNFTAIANAISDLSGRITSVWVQMFPEDAQREAEYQRQMQAAAAQQAAQADATAAPQPIDLGPAPVDLSPVEPTAEEKPAAKKPAAKKPAAKKAPAKKAAAKKPAAKKAPAKKATTKKAAKKD